MRQHTSQPNPTGAEAPYQHRFLNTLPLIRRIAMSRLTRHYRESIEDVVQTVSLNLWAWQQRREQRANEALTNENQTAANENQLLIDENQSINQPAVNEPVLKEPELSEESWLKLANRASVNEINSFYTSKFRRELLWAEPEQYSLPDMMPEYSTYRIEGETKTEITSLLRHLWGALQALSLRQRYALLLNKDEFIDDLIGHGVCRMQDMADFLFLSREQFVVLLAKLPLADAEIGALITERTRTETTLNQVWTARGKAKIKLARELADNPKEDDRAVRK